MFVKQFILLLNVYSLWENASARGGETGGFESLNFAAKLYWILIKRLHSQLFYLFKLLKNAPDLRI